MRIFLLLLTTLFVIQLSGQTAKPYTTYSVNLTQEEYKKVITDEVKKTFGIDYPIFRVYQFTDKTGKYYTVLTEKTDSIGQKKDTMHFKIKAFHFLQDKNGLVKKWELSDFILNQNGAQNEYNIWFWGKYCEFTDLDKDGIVEPIIVYGTFAADGFSDGRIKILTYYKGQKSVIRHQNSPVDYGRHTQVDESFYNLPNNIQEQVKKHMQRIMDNNHGIFPAGWQNSMKKRKLKFNEVYR